MHDELLTKYWYWKILILMLLDYSPIYVNGSVMAEYF